MHCCIDRLFYYRTISDMNERRFALCLPRTRRRRGCFTKDRPWALSPPYLCCYFWQACIPSPSLAGGRFFRVLMSRSASSWPSSGSAHRPCCCAPPALRRSGSPWYFHRDSRKPVALPGSARRWYRHCAVRRFLDCVYDGGLVIGVVGDDLSRCCSRRCDAAVDVAISVRPGRSRILRAARLADFWYLCHSRFQRVAAQMGGHFRPGDCRDRRVELATDLDTSIALLDPAHTISGFCVDDCGWIFAAEQRRKGRQSRSAACAFPVKLIQIHD